MIAIAWRILSHEVGRSALAIAGIFVTILMVFLQLGFFSAVPTGGMALYNHMRFDILITARSYVFQGQTYTFPRRRIYTAQAISGVLSGAPIYQASPHWSDEQDHNQHDLFLIGFRTEDQVLDAPDIARQLGRLSQPDTVLIDQAVHPVYGTLTPGRLTEIGARTVTLAGTYAMGIGFLGLGVGVTSDLNFIRINPDRALDAVNLGLITIKPGADADDVARRIRAVMPPDVRIFTRAELTAHETDYWTIRTSTGIVFGFGVVVAIIVGLVIIYQTLSTQVARQLPQYATLKAMGYTDLYLAGIVVSVSLIMAGIAFVPAAIASVGVYAIVQEATKLPIWMTGSRLVVVVCVTVVISSGSALYALGGLRRADPVDLF